MCERYKRIRVESNTVVEPTRSFVDGNNNRDFWIWLLLVLVMLLLGEGGEDNDGGNNVGRHVQSTKDRHRVNNKLKLLIITV
jgi:hypothetical protein